MTLFWKKSCDFYNSALLTKYFRLATDEHHTVVSQEILATELFKYKPQTQQQSNLWYSIVYHLNDVKNPAFSVTQRGIKDKFIADKKEQDKASGINV
ncbi:hypothetical protein P5673_024476 [Acropora cervicornis]|uniref:Uncharacterized protein n=1 Tax=Acropora cervicornis TaxID=6130 RepID=A0AAD9Q3Z8_ACRCE|nr:hypothetical protein P5673_024476 [Acropora cervicornis]